MTKGDKRRYIRISTVLPIEFFIIDAHGKKFTPWLQGFTHDIGKGGICLLINDLWWGFGDRLSHPSAHLFLRVNFPFKSQPLCLKAEVSWVKQERISDFNRYSVGLKFVEDDQKRADSLFKYAIVKKSTPVVVSMVIAVLLFFSFSLFWRMGSLARKNRKLVSDYVSILEKRSSLEEALEEGVSGEELLKERQLNLELAIDSLNEEVIFWQGKYDALVTNNNSSIVSLEEALSFKKKLALLELELASLGRENDFL